MKYDFIKHPLYNNIEAYSTVIWFWYTQIKQHVAVNIFSFAISAILASISSLRMLDYNFNLDKKVIGETVRATCNIYHIAHDMTK